jgi:16S rRNA (guanine527-N7)-methyltransferase
MIGPAGCSDAEAVAGLQKAFGVSHETLRRLQVHVDLLRRWQTQINLIAPDTLPDIWGRHVADTLQLAPLAPNARLWLDLGSGAGFPGLVLAAALHERGGRVLLVESDQRKAAFLREAARHMQVTVDVQCQRIETCMKRLPVRPDAVTARALAPLSRLIDWTHSLVGNGVPGVFPKGRTAEVELTEARKSWTVEARLVPSRTDPQSKIVVIDQLTRLPAH